VPVARQVLRAFGRNLGVASEDLEDAEIATTEALANAVQHAYSGEGSVEVSMLAETDSLAVTVRDRGRGMPMEHGGPENPRLGIAIIESLADEAEFVSKPQQPGTRVSMRFRVARTGGMVASGGERVEVVVRRAVAVVAAQADLAMASLGALLDVIGLAARAVPEHLLAPAATMTIDRLERGLELRLGPLEGAGADAIVSTTSKRLWSSRLATSIDIYSAPGNFSSGEDLVLRVG
jgi:serine/threonine-protein kinase RsbW